MSNNNPIDEKSIFPNYIYDDVLDPDATKYDELIKKLNYCLSQMEKLKTKRGCKYYINSDFNYSDIDMSDLGKPSEPDIALLSSLKAFEGVLLPHQPSTLFNILPQPLIGTTVLSMLTLLHNPNSLLDITAGKFIYLEKKIIRYLASMVGWNSNKAGGFFTFGGKATLMYGVKAGLSKVNNQVIENGVDDQYYVICSENNHYCIENICNFLGIGTRQCKRISLGRSGTLQLNEFVMTVEEQLRNGKHIAAVILNAGSTINMVVDPIRKIKQKLRYLQRKYNLTYAIHLHVDTVITWPWMFFINKNLADIDVTLNIKRKICNITKDLKDLYLADSIGIDFHKTGLCPYISSCFICNNREDIHFMHSDDISLFNDSENYYSQCYDKVSFENSRPCNGIISAYYVIKRLGQQGFIDYITYLYRIADYFAQVMENKYQKYYEVVNKSSNGYEIVFFIKFSQSFQSFDKTSKLDKKSVALYEKYCQRFIGFMFRDEWVRKNDVPFISFVPGYKNYGSKDSATAFLIYPASLNITFDKVDEIMQSLTNALKKFLVLNVAEIEQEHSDRLKKPPR